MQTHSSQTVIYAIFIFCIIYAALFVLKPKFLYTPDGAIKAFGVGYERKTFIPVWVLSILLGILSYLWAYYYTRGWVRYSTTLAF